MGKVIWSSEEGFVGNGIDFQELVHCLSCKRSENCPSQGECNFITGWKHYIKDESSEYARLVVD